MRIFDIAQGTNALRVRQVPLGRWAAHERHHPAARHARDLGPVTNEARPIPMGQVGLVIYKATADFDDFRAYQP